jgi:hypothetical protein
MGVDGREEGREGRVETNKKKLKQSRPLTEEEDG